ncbi:MAG: protein kinase [Acidobacteriota bacterium]
MHEALQQWQEIESLVDRLDVDHLDADRRVDDPLVHGASSASDVRGVPVDHPLEHSLEHCFGHLLERALAKSSVATLGPGDPVGPYRIEAEVGAGGMGTVYLAHRADGSFERKVAVKLLHRCPSDDTAHSRFLRERQILAGLRHPHIAQLLDGGEIEGVPYLVMEHVDGLPLTDYCDLHGLGPEERIRLVVQACDAVHHAHRRGVIHRDLKPSNLLVEDTEGEARVVVLDFGIALLEHDDVFVTSTGQVFGTPGYMAPEQALGQREEIDRRVDVYALGVLLYELLCGRRPYEGQSGREILHKLIGDEPTPLRRHLPQVSTDLSTLVATCLERQPSRRYDSVRALREDLDRYLDGSPIAARPASWAQRWWRQAQRRPQLAALVVAAAAITVASLIFSALQAWEHSRDLQVERNAALEAQREAEELLDFMLQDLHFGLEQLGRLDLLEQVARKSLGYYERRSGDVSSDVLAGRATALYNAGRVLEEQGDVDAALEAYGRTHRAFEQLVRTDADPRWHFQLARSHRALAGTLATSGEPARALEHILEAVAWTRHLSTLDQPPPGWTNLHFECLALHGWIVREAGPAEQAMSILGQARDFAAAMAAHFGSSDGSDSCSNDCLDWRHQRAVAISYIGLVHLQDGDLEAALTSFQQAREECEDLVVRKPENNSWREELQLVLSRLGSVQLDLERLDASEAAFIEARRQSDLLLRLEPGNSKWLRELSVVHASLAAIHRTRGDLAEARDAIESSLEISRMLTRRFPENHSARNDLAWDLLDFGRVLQALGESGKGRGAWTEAVQIMRQIRREAPESVYYLDTEAQALLELGRRDEARPLIQRLYALGWQAPDFIELCEKHGLGPEQIAEEQPLDEVGAPPSPQPTSGDDHATLAAP